MKRLIPVLVITLVLAACGGSDLIRTFRVALAASGPLVNSLVASGAIQQSDASAIIGDFGDGAACADTLHTAFNAIPKDAPNAKSQKLNASVNGLRCFRQILQRRNFDKHARVKQSADIAEGILASLVVFYSEPGQIVARDRGATRAITAKDEKELEKKLKRQIEELKATLEP